MKDYKTSTYESDNEYKIRENLFSLLTFFIFSGTIRAQEEKEPSKISNLSISGSVDAYFQTNLSAPEDIAQFFGTSFADELGFSLGMANIIASYEGSKIGGVADLTFGPRGDTAIGGYNVNQLFVYWNVS